MANAIVRLPLGYFPDPDIGRPLWNAKIYVGVVDLDPRIPSNQVQVTGRQENGDEIPLDQPIRTNKGGVPVDVSGNVVTLLVDGAYSMAVDDRKDSQKYYFANVLDGEPVTFNDKPVLYRDTVAEAVADEGLTVGQSVNTLGYYNVNDGGGAEYVVVAGGTGTDDGGSYHDMSNGNQLELIVSSLVNIKEFGATGDGVTDDTGPVNSANDSSKLVSEVPDGEYSTTMPIVGTDGNFSGVGKIKTGSSLRGNNLRRLKTQPSPLSNGNGITDFFNNDFSFPDNFDVSVTGSTTVGTPTTGYEQYDQVTPFFTGALFQSGHNESTTDAAGRTGWALSRARLQQNGDGDCFCQNWNVVVSNNNSSHTGLFGKPAGGFWNGNMQATVNDIYFNPVEYNLEDNGFNVRSAGLVINNKRDNNDATFGEWWCGVRMQATGTLPPDAAYQAAGEWNILFDCTPANETTKAITMTKGQEVHFDAEAPSVSADAKSYAQTFAGTKMKANSVSGDLETHIKNVLISSATSTLTKFNTDLEAPIILVSPNSTRYRIIVDNAGNLSTEPE